MLLLAAIFAAGLLHGIGPDHLAAISTFGFAVGHNFRRVVFFAMRFAGGHALVLGAAGVLGHFGRMLLSPSWERRFDLAGGGLLVFTGVLALWALITGRVKIHEHGHTHGAAHHGHYHLHLGVGHAHAPAQENRRPEQHQHLHGGLAATLGILFALGGTRSLIAVVPIAISQTLAITILRVSVFVLGIIVSMVGYAFLTQRAFSRLTAKAQSVGRAPRFLLASSYLLALFCIVAGLMTIRERLLV
ncbi:MAG TPA: hypothetical protein VEG30_07660 [Terriglobales bacterium]|nr:hypothetical protein [Terriglobales bacterium]